MPEVCKLQQHVTGRPVVRSDGGVGAFGGETRLIGSIGIVGGRTKAVECSHLQKETGLKFEWLACQGEQGKKCSGSVSERPVFLALSATEGNGDLHHFAPGLALAGGGRAG